MVASDNEICPVCAAKNENGKLTLFQVNLGQAIKLCSRRQVFEGMNIRYAVTLHGPYIKDI